MFLKEFDTNKEKFNKIQTYLKENFKFEIATEKLNEIKADRLIERSENRLKTVNQKTNPKEYTKLKLVSEGLKLWKLTEQEEDSGDMDEARIILSAEEITTKLQDMVEKIAELQVQKLIPIVDKMKEELGPNEAARFNQIADSSLAELLNIAKSTKDKISTAIVQVSSGTTSMDQDMGMQQSQGLDSLDDMGDDGFDGDDAVSGDIGPEGRKMKGESIDFEDALLLLKEATKDGKISRKDFNKIIGKK